MTTAITPLTQAHIYAQKKDAGAQLKTQTYRNCHKLQLTSCECIILSKV